MIRAEDGFLGEFRYLYAARHLDYLAPQVVVEWAALVDAPPSAALVLADIAAVLDVSAATVDPLVAELAEVLGVPPMTEELAGLLLGLHVAERLIKGEVEAYPAAKMLWRIARLAPRAEPSLRVFVGLASEWEDSPKFRPEYEEQIREACIDFIRSRSG